MNKIHKINNIGYVFFGTGLIIIFLSIALINPLQNIFYSEDNVQEITSLANKERLLQNKKALNINADLMKAAQQRAEDIAKNQNFENNLSQPWEIINRTDYNFKYAGENLALSNKSNQEIVYQWMQSSIHKANILNNDYNDIGVGTANINSYRNYNDLKLTVVFLASQKYNSSEESYTFPTNLTVLLNNFQKLPKNIFIFIGVILVIIGLILEYRQIKLHNKSHKN